MHFHTVTNTSQKTLTSPVLGFQYQDELAGRDIPGHLTGTLPTALLTGNVERGVPIVVLQGQTGPPLHQPPHHRRQVQVRGQV